MQQATQQVIARCKEVMERAKAVYGLDLTGMQISFDLRGRAAGYAHGERYRGVGTDYKVRFNRDMMMRDELKNIIDEVVPHEIAHIVCYMNPALGRNHNPGWKRVCLALGGTGSRTHSLPVVYGKGNTYEYTTDKGHTIRLTERKHKAVQGGQTLRVTKNRGAINSMCAYSIVGMNGRTLSNPIVKDAPNSAEMLEVAVAETRVAKMVKQAPHVPVEQPAGRQMSKAEVSRRIMQLGFRSGHSYETIIAAMMTTNGYTRQLARATFKANAARVGIPSTFC